MAFDNELLSHVGGALEEPPPHGDLVVLAAVTPLQGSRGIALPRPCPFRQLVGNPVQGQLEALHLRLCYRGDERQRRRGDGEVLAQLRRGDFSIPSATLALISPIA